MSELTIADLFLCLGRVDSNRKEQVQRRMAMGREKAWTRNARREESTVLRRSGVKGPQMTEENEGIKALTTVSLSSERGGLDMATRHAPFIYHSPSTGA